MRVTLAGAARPMRQTDESKQFFFLQKKNQKTLVYKALALPRRVRQMDKIFCFFLQKEVLSSCRCVSLKATWYTKEFFFTKRTACFLLLAITNTNP
jgi:hypothetical protein